ncbi:aldose epimerase family protein [Burkholderia plantarii]|uniref:aldose epimerase family protein n=1 Tax=Burkholderia plantarii TaxID=41899 RepID=UPI0006D8C43D|nr:aldose epimerase family protein [Burkholderia plantarii]ALK32499.1 Aldose 1-epimerase [Burkholderia plantarii]GLZ19872.1 aldose 1-epimerase [Burkholderia plantarii]
MRALSLPMSRPASRLTARPARRGLVPGLKLAACALAASAWLAATPAWSATMTEAPYGTTRDGKPVTEYTLKNAHGTTVRLINYGGCITAIEVPDRHGKFANIVLGFASLKDYETYNGDIHFGALIGRYANRIAGGKFTLDGKTYQLPVNNAPNTLHGGPDSFDSKVWSAKPASGKDGAGVELTYVSPDGENGFPGTLTARVTYLLTDDNALHIRYEATTDKDTVVNLTNHTYFNLAGEGSGSVEQQEIRIAASRYTPTDRTSIPTGELAPVEGTPLDLRQFTPIGRYLRSNFEQMVYARGYDHNWVLDHGGQRVPAFAASVRDPHGGRVLSVDTTQPGLQFYSANSLDGSAVGASGHAYRQTDAFALEAEHFPDSPNHPAFPTTVLKPGDTLREETVLRFSVR